MPRLSSHEMCVGAGCLIFKDGIWRRAVIVNCCEKISFDVKLIDTGAYDKISQDRVSFFPVVNRHIEMLTELLNLHSSK